MYTYVFLPNSASKCDMGSHMQDGARSKPHLDRDCETVSALLGMVVVLCCAEVEREACALWMALPLCHLCPPRCGQVGSQGDGQRSPLPRPPQFAKVRVLQSPKESKVMTRGALWNWDVSCVIEGTPSFCQSCSIWNGFCLLCCTEWRSRCCSYLCLHPFEAISLTRSLGNQYHDRILWEVQRWRVGCGGSRWPSGQEDKYIYSLPHVTTSVNTNYHTFWAREFW